MPEPKLSGISKAPASIQKLARILLPAIEQELAPLTQSDVEIYSCNVGVIDHPLGELWRGTLETAKEEFTRVDLISFSLIPSKPDSSAKFRSVYKSNLEKRGTFFISVFADGTTSISARYSQDDFETMETFISKSRDERITLDSLESAIDNAVNKDESTSLDG
ncbi:hypothetical protein [Halosimplex halophilum]|uniref:hypothetical protein n=1 Tax=Halosimplex halophilum TaxID=2559572 RepID=UPI00107EF322|nr:hypothetical protein [Halosimplex halophilum]